MPKGKASMEPKSEAPNERKCSVCGLAEEHCEFQRGCSCWRWEPCRKDFDEDEDDNVAVLRDWRD